MAEGDSIALKRSYVIGFVSLHFTTLIMLAFWVGVTYQRIGGLEQRELDNSLAITAIRETGTAAVRIEIGAMKEQLGRIELRLNELDAKLAKK